MTATVTMASSGNAGVKKTDGKTVKKMYEGERTAEALSKFVDSHVKKEAKAKVIADEDSIRKADEEFRSKYGYLFTISGTTTKPDKFTLDNIDNFITNFNHGNKIPMDAIFNDNPSRIYIVYPNCVILKTNKEVIFVRAIQLCIRSGFKKDMLRMFKIAPSEN